MKLYKLIQNEMFKMINKKRLFIVLGLLFIMIAAFAYGQHNSIERTREQTAKRIGISASNDWHKILEQRIIEIKNRIDSPGMDDTRIARMRVQMEQFKYYLDNNINPIDVTNASFTTKFMEQSLFLFLPLLIIILAADIVSGELGAGTIKLLLVQGVPRWRILLSKYITLITLQLVVLFFAFVFSSIISGFFFGFRGWTAPVSTGFKVIGGQLVTSDIVNVPQWQYTMMVYGAAYFVALAVGTVSFMVSVIVKSTAASIGIILSALIGGSILSNFVADWKLARYLFSVNLRLTDYISGSLQPIEGMDMTFSVAVLSVWIIGALMISFIYFTKRDIMV
ncbi:MAG: ABC transporter permease [Bacillota bacterium]|nr:ABC transporter permease [Bacillota bacterium]